ncbi:Glycine hydroxymethyltransferase, partial [mine drainage metagenome]
EFKRYAEQVVSNAKALAGNLMDNGTKLVTNGTDNHMMLADLSGISPGIGIFAQEALDKAGITINKNTVPNDPSSPFYPSGIRIGTPAITTRGMKEPEMADIAALIRLVLDQVSKYKLPSGKEARSTYIKAFQEEISKNDIVSEVRAKVAALAEKFPLYADLIS